MADRKPQRERPAARLPDRGGTDTATLVDMGLAEPPPEPAERTPAGPSPREQANEAALQAALTDAGVTKGGRDEQVIDALAKLDPADVEAVTRWLRHGKTDRPADPPEDPRK